jgi:hypothetical protein
MKFGEILAGSIPILGLVALVGTRVIDEAKHAKTEMVSLSSEKTVRVLDWKDDRAIEIYVGGFQTMHDTNRDGKIDYISGGAMSRIGTFRYTLNPSQNWQELYEQTISKSSKNVLQEVK